MDWTRANHYARSNRGRTQSDGQLRLKRGGGGGAGDGVQRRHRWLFPRVAYLGLRSARGNVEQRKIERHRRASSPRDHRARRGDNLFMRR
jgi:hypothetical protein